MAYNSNPPQQKYVASAGQTVFPFLFKIFQDADLTVYKVTEGDDPEEATPLTLNVDYTVIINGELGGSITLTVGASDGASVTIYRRLDIVRYVEYQTSGDLLADTLNADQDYQTYLTADLADAVKEELSGAGPGVPISDAVRRSGDTMTGNLDAPSFSVNGVSVIQGGVVGDNVWIQYSDGTMICYGLAPGVISSTGVGNIFRSVSYNVTYPKTFIVSPTVTVGAANVSGSTGWAGTFGGDINGISLYLFSATNNTYGNPTYQAIGRWK